MRCKNSIKLHCLSGIALGALAVTGVATPVAAQDAPTSAETGTRTYAISAQPLDDAIRQFAIESGVDIVFSPKAVEGKRSEGLQGRYGVMDGLRRLIRGTGLVVRRTGSGYAVVTPAADAIAEISSPDDDGRTGTLEILIVGKRTQNLDIPRTEDAARPYVVFDDEEIRKSQTQTLEEFLKSRLPMNTASLSDSQITGRGSTLSNVNLRGLGTDQTLILVDGRRMPSIGNGDGAPLQADINGIPLDAIERIEVLPSSASGIYGGNAVGGVINVILKSDYSGFEVKATYQDTFDFAFPSVRLEASGGFPLEGGRTRVTFGGSFSDAGVLRVGERDLVQRGVELYYRNVDVENPTTTPPRTAGVNIRTRAAGGLTLDDGTSLGSGITSLPAGFAGDLEATLLARAGTYDLTTPKGLYGENRGLLSAPEQRSFFINARREFTNWLDLLVGYYRFDNKGKSQSANSVPESMSLAGDSPLNPFQEAINVTFDTPNLDYPYISKSSSDRFIASAIIDLPGGWAANIDYTRNWARYETSFTTDSLDAGGQCAIAGYVPSDAICVQYLGTDPNDTRGPINPFAADNGADQYFLEGSDASVGPNRSTLTTPSLRVSGPLFALPGGDAVLSMAISRDTYDSEGSFYEFLGSSGGSAFRYYPGRYQRSTSEYAELTLPIVSPGNDVPFVHLLELQGAIRADQYLTRAPEAAANNFYYPDGLPDPLPDYDVVEAKADSVNYTLAARWAPSPDIMLRASYATGFLPPNVVQVADSITLRNTFITDPKRGNVRERLAVEARSGSGSPDLDPELSRTFSFGGILTPRFVEGLRISVDYTRIRKTDEITSLPLDTLVVYEDLFPGRLDRAELTDADRALGYTGGVIIGYDTTPINASKASIEVLDFQIDYRFGNENIGEFRAYALGSYYLTQTRQLLPNLPELEYVGYSNGPLEWRGNGGLEWSKGGLSVSWNAQFYDSYFVYGSYDMATSNGQLIVQNAITAQGEERIPSQMYHDLSISYDFGESSSIFNDVTIFAGFQNVFNTEPPVIASSSYLMSGYSTYGDPRLRRFTLSLRKGF